MALEITLNYADPTTDLAAKQPFTIFPGEVNTNSTSLTMVGQGTMNYGKYIMNDLLHMLENFCSDDEPANATRGQLWFDTSENTLKVYTFADGNIVTKQWETIGGVHVGVVPPLDKSTLWYDTNNVDAAQWQLKIFNPSPAVNAWVSIAARYVQRSGDTLTGDLTFTTTDKGLVGVVSGFTNRISPATNRGPAMIGGQHATVVINNAAATPTGGEFVVGTGTSLSAATDSNGRLFSVSDAGVVTIHKNVLSLNDRKITNVAAGTISDDAVNYGQLTSVQSGLQASINTLNTTVSNHATTLLNKVSKTGDTMSGALTINNTLYVGNTLTAVAITCTGSITVTNNISAGNDIHAGGNLTATGPTQLSSTLTVGGAVQLNSTLITNGATQLKSTVTITGAATLSNSLAVGGNVTVGGNTTLTGIAVMNQPWTAITASRHLTTKEYVDVKFLSIPTPAVPRGLWAGVTTLAGIAATYADLNAFPYGTVVGYTYQWTYVYGTGNGAATATASARRAALRTENAGWIEIDRSPN